ncbi:hypothetical protein DVJ77_17615 [Dyella tabacisoli]|uniref:Adhesin n=1 Tax=Dyella tabacisoli TaxID=2282381 RepID=A0A369UKW2_9GAMM|nr:hypothetical protein DVJ77_17615 [Dyella tabacisoli]
MLALAFASAGTPAAAADDYTAMLGYLNSRIDGQAFQNTHGASAVNMAAGDLNLQANLRAFASGEYAQTVIYSLQQQRNNHYDTPLTATASIGGAAYAGGQGLASINQASGSGNAELNVITATLANQGIREATDVSLSTAVSASAGEQSTKNPHTQSGGTRSVAVESSALQGFQGVLQLNQIAGSGNATGNLLLLTAPPSR